jgi:sarcosine oxidase
VFRMKLGIVGAGIFGIAAAIELAERGHEVTVFERGSVPSAQASSTDVSKVIRRWAYADNETYVELVERAAINWARWQQEFESTVYHKVGQVRALPDWGPESPMRRSVEYLQGRGAGIEILTPTQARKRFPRLVLLDSETIVYDQWAGYVESGLAVEYMARMARDRGVRILVNMDVRSVAESPEGSRLVLDDGTEHTFDRIVVAAGAWVGGLVPQLNQGLTITRQQMVIIAPDRPEIFAPGAMGVWSIEVASGQWYGFPLLRSGYVKVADDATGEQIDPDVDRGGKPEFAQRAMGFLRERVPELGTGRLVAGRTCLYTNTPDDHFVIDWAPGSSRVLVAGCGTSHGFKFGSSIGPVIADALEDRDNPLGRLFRLGNRFAGGVEARDPRDKGFLHSAG